MDGVRKERRGFASMSPEKQREIASKGGRAAHEKGTAHEWTPDEARQPAARVARSAAAAAVDSCPAPADDMNNHSGGSCVRHGAGSRRLAFSRADQQLRLDRKREALCSCVHLSCGVARGRAGAWPPPRRRRPGCTTTTTQTAVTQDEIVLQGDTTPTARAADDLRRHRPVVRSDGGNACRRQDGRSACSAPTSTAGRVSPTSIRSVSPARSASAIGSSCSDRGGPCASTATCDPCSCRPIRRSAACRRNTRTCGAGWSKTSAGRSSSAPSAACISQSRGDAMSLAPRFMVKFPSRLDMGEHQRLGLHLDLVASREFGQRVELTGIAGRRASAATPTNSACRTASRGARRAVSHAGRRSARWSSGTGEFVIEDNTQVVNPPFVAEDGSIAPTLEPDLRSDELQVRRGLASRGRLVRPRWPELQLRHRAAGPSAAVDIEHSAWGFDVRLGWHPGVTPRARARARHQGDDDDHQHGDATAAAGAAPPPPNRNPTFSVAAICDPGVVEPGQTSSCTATATDPDGDPLTYPVDRAGGHVQPADARRTRRGRRRTSPATVPVTVTATDNRGGTATASVTMQVVRRRGARVRGRALRLRSVQPAAGCAEDPRRRRGQAAGATRTCR